jgi:CTP:molybdopterin cytidylyltransferase MocA
MNEMKFAALILAAGRSSRMGAFKPLLRIDGRAIMETVIDMFRITGVSDILVVLGYQADILIPLLEDLDVSWVLNKDFDRGMFSSVQTGAKSLDSSRKAFFLMPADMPLVRPGTIEKLASSWLSHAADVLHPCFNGKRGHPPLISTSLIPPIAEFDGSGGMRAFLSSPGITTLDLECEDPGVLTDLDTQKDFQKIISCIKT